jgi:hypothetical protein
MPGARGSQSDSIIKQPDANNASWPVQWVQGYAFMRFAYWLSTTDLNFFGDRLMLDRQLSLLS